MHLACILVLGKVLSYHRYYFAIYVDNISKLSDNRQALYVILYADDILLLPHLL